MTRYMARYTGMPRTPGPVHAIRPRKAGEPSWRSPVTYCGVTAAGVGSWRVEWRDVELVGRICPKCRRKMPQEEAPAS